MPHSLPRSYAILPTPGLGQPIIVNGLPGLILDLVGRADGHWLVRTSRGQECRIERPLRQMGDSMAWLGCLCEGAERATVA